MPETELKAIIADLFTAVITFDRELVIQDISVQIENRCPSIKPGMKLLDVLQIHRPAKVETAEDVLRHMNSLFLLITRREQFAFRGQVVYSTEDGLFSFVGSPWMAWMEKNAPETSLTLNDFPKHDSQLDQGFLIATQKNMLQDLQYLNQELEKARKDTEMAYKSRTDLFAVMSHEMRTPLNGVITSLSLLEDGDTKVSAEKLLTMADTSAKNLLQVINHVLDFSKLEANKMKIEETKFDILELVESVTSIMHSQALNKGIDLKTIIDKKMPRCFLGDDAKIRQILINLVSNAIKFTKTGAVTIKLAARASEAGTTQLTFEIIDTGAGIPESVQENLFEPFCSASDYTRTGELASSGLGLNICKRMVELLGGTIGYSTRLGKGTIIWFEISLKNIAVSPELANPGNLKNQHDLMNRTLSGKVLLVDDNQTNLILGQALMEKYGVKVRTAINGREALEIAEKLQFDLILMDITMPEMNGIEATKLIKKTSKNSATPIIAVTANTFSNDIDEFLEQGMDGFLAKPLNRQELVELLQQWLIVSEVAVKKANTRPVTQQLLNRKTLMQVKNDIGEEGFPHVMDVFLKETDERFRNMMQAWGNDDIETVRLEAHTLYSSVLSMGAEALASRLRKIETAAKQQAEPDLLKEKVGISQLYQQSIADIQQLCRELST